MSTDAIKLELYKKQFGIHLKAIRESKNMSQVDLAVAINEINSKNLIEKTTISRIENGRTNVTLTTAVKISQALNIELKELFNFTI